MMENIIIKIIPQLKDNYSFILKSNNNSSIVIIDPAESSYHLKFLKKNNLELNCIFLTHHHKDHTAGVSDLLDKYPNVKIYSPSYLIKSTTNEIKNDNLIHTNINKFRVIETPGHTLDHIILHDSENNLLFCGDTLFRLGCGRIFEGTFDQMYNSLQKINILPNKTKIFCGHEYTENNLKFLKNIFNNTEELIKINKLVNLQIGKTGSSIPFYLGDEKKVNPFLNQDSDLANILKIKHNLSNKELFVFLREKKDNF